MVDIGSKRPRSTIEGIDNVVLKNPRRLSLGHHCFLPLGAEILKCNTITALDIGFEPLLDSSAVNALRKYFESSDCQVNDFTFGGESTPQGTRRTPQISVLLAEGLLKACANLKGLKTLKVRNLTLGRDAGKVFNAFVDGVKKGRNLKPILLKFALVHCKINAHGGRALAVAIQAAKSDVSLSSFALIEEIGTSGQYRCGDQATGQLALSVSCQNLCELMLEGVGIQNPYSGFLSVIDLVQDHHLTKLKYISFRGNRLTCTGMEKLARACSWEGSRIEVLDLSACNLNGAAIKPFISKVASFKVLRKLNLSENRLDDKCLILFADLLRQSTPSLKVIDLSCNKYGGRGLHAMIRALNSVPTINSLDLRDSAGGFDISSASKFQCDRHTQVRLVGFPVTTMFDGEVAPRATRSKKWTENT